MVSQVLKYYEGFKIPISTKWTNYRYDISKLIIYNYSDWHDENDDQGEDSWLDALYSEKLSRRDLGMYILTSRKMIVVILLVQF